MGPGVSRSRLNNEVGMDLLKLFDFDYGDLMANDLILKFKGLIEAGNFVIDADTSKIRPRFEKLEDYRTPWFHVKHEPQSQCGLWHKVIFDNFKFIAKGCYDCWKVVIRPWRFEDIYKTLRMQIELDRPSKCGAEVRKSVFGPWGAYWYNRSMEAGQECYETICREVKNRKINLLYNKDGEIIKPLLKRGCTEFEMELGPSDKWEYTEQNERMENFISQIVDVRSVYQTRMTKVYVLREWAEQAYSLGDPTVLFMNDGEMFYKPYITYHKEVNDA
jgi:hypothetical protein